MPYLSIYLNQSQLYESNLTFRWLHVIITKSEEMNMKWIIENESVRSASKLLNLRVKMEKKWQFNEKFRSDAAHLSVQSRSYIYLIVIFCHFQDLKQITCK